MMRLLAHHRSWILSLLLTALCVAFGTRAEAQVDSTWDHYKVYKLVNPPAIMLPPVLLRDQFGEFQHQVFRMPYFANPVEKRVPDPANPRISPIHDPNLHYTWWDINPSPFDATVRIENQFGFQELRVHEGVFLLNPALKNNTTPQLPERNHYKCYRCDGPPVNVGVVLLDQFDTWQTTVTIPRWFCNPVFKQVAGQPPHPIINGKQHYTVYEFNPPDTQVFPALVRDQFGQFSVDLTPGLFLMVPTDKLLVTDAKPSTWGKIKSLYR